MGVAGADHAPRVEFERAGERRGLKLSAAARLLVGYLALEARDPATAERRRIQAAILEGRPDDDFDAARDELERALADLGLADAFRPYRKGAPDADTREVRGRFSLRGPRVSSDLPELLGRLRSGKIDEAAQLVREVTKREGDCEPLELVELDAPRGIEPAHTWYREKADRLRRLLSEHQVAISAPKGSEREPSSRAIQGHRHRPRWRLIGTAAGALVIAAAATALAISSGGGHAAGHCPLASLTAPSSKDLAAQHIPNSAPGSAHPQPPIVMRSRPRSIAVGSEGVWVAQSTDGSVWLIDPKLNRPVGEPIPVGGTPYSIALAKDVIWVTREDGTLVAIDRRTRRLRPEVYKYGAGSGEVSLGAGSIWVNNYDDRYAGGISRINPCSGQVDHIHLGQIANTVKFAYGSVWVSDSDEHVLHRLDPQTRKVTDVLLPVGDPQDVGAGAGYIWVVNYGPKRVTRVDPKTNRVVGAPIQIGPGGAGVAVAGGAVWIPNYEGDSVSRIDLDTLRSEPEASRVGVSPTDIASGFGRIWVPDNDAEPPSVTAVIP